MQKFNLNLIDYLDIKQLVSSSDQIQIVLPGDLISSEEGYMHGYGTYKENNKIYSNMVGTIKKTNKLLTVEPIRSYYIACVGDFIIGKITEISKNKWIVDIGTKQKATLNLNSIYFAEQRIRDEKDELIMRDILKENDYISAEVHSINNDNSINLHLRSQKFGKLTNGILLYVNHLLLKKYKHSIVKLSDGVSTNVNIIMSHNGRIWISTCNQSNEDIFSLIQIKQIIELLDQQQCQISIENINKILLFQKELKQNNQKSDLTQATIQFLAQKLQNNMNELIKLYTESKYIEI